MSALGQTQTLDVGADRSVDDPIQTFAWRNEGESTLPEIRSTFGDRNAVSGLQINLLTGSCWVPYPRSEAYRTKGIACAVTSQTGSHTPFPFRNSVFDCRRCNRTHRRG